VHDDACRVDDRNQPRAPGLRRVVEPDEDLLGQVVERPRFASAVRAQMIAFRGDDVARGVENGFARRRVIPQPRPHDGEQPFDTGWPPRHRRFHPPSRE
jgi:hypothetical protein